MVHRQTGVLYGHFGHKEGLKHSSLNNLNVPTLLITESVQENDSIPKNVTGILFLASSSQDVGSLVPCKLSSFMMRARRSHVFVAACHDKHLFSVLTCTHNAWKGKEAQVSVHLSRRSIVVSLWSSDLEAHNVSCGLVNQNALASFKSPWCFDTSFHPLLRVQKWVPPEIMVLKILGLIELLPSLKVLSSKYVQDNASSCVPYVRPRVTTFDLLQDSIDISSTEDTSLIEERPTLFHHGRIGRVSSYSLAELFIWKSFTWCSFI